MSFEALGRTYHGGAPTPLRPGDLVTAADAPDRAPTWVGAVELATNHVPPLYRVNQIGNGSFFMNPWEIRPLTDTEAVGLAEMLLGEAWKIYPSGAEIGASRLCTDPSAWLDTDTHGEWMFSQDDHSDIGFAGSLAAGKACASRALIAYTIRGK